MVVVMPAYNAARTLEATYRGLAMDIVDEVILVDDVSHDETVDIAERLGLKVVVHIQNRGYGGNQKTCYVEALRSGADVVVMVHPDNQYDSTLVPQMIEPILAGEADIVLGSRFLSGTALSGGMPWWKFISNRFLTIAENVVFGLGLSEYHTGFRAYSRRLLETLPKPKMTPAEVLAYWAEDDSPSVFGRTGEDAVTIARRLRKEAECRSWAS